MSNIHRAIISFVLVILAVSCATSPTAMSTPSPSPLSTATVAPATATPTLSALPEAKIERHPAPFNFDYRKDLGEFVSIPKYDPNSEDSLQVDLRSRDLTGFDLTASLANLLYASFDNLTRWPPAEKMPAGFDPESILQLGKDPGLGLRALHKQGRTGKGIGIAIIDQPLLVDHQEYRDRLQLYEEINMFPDTMAGMHGAAVASIAVGKTVGVAPEADLYYIGAWTGDWNLETHEFTPNLKYYAQGVRRILEIDRSLPPDRKIRVIAMQVGWMRGQAGYEEIMAAVRDAKAAGIYVISSSLRQTYEMDFQGLGRDPRADPNQFDSYVPGLWWEQDFYAGRPSEKHKGLPPDFYTSKVKLLVPMDSRTTASPTGAEDYVFYRAGGWSWSIPYFAGMYALCVQVKPDITPEEFWALALKTGRTIQIEHGGKDYQFEIILDPQALIEALR